MRAFDIYKNGRKICSAGIPEPGVVTASVTWVTDSSAAEREDMDFCVGGLISRTHTFIDWARRPLKEGDELKIIVTQKSEVSKPKKERTKTEAERQSQKLIYLKRLAKELGYEIRKEEA